MQDYSDYLATFPRKISQLTNLLNDKKWKEAKELADEMADDLRIVADIAWSNDK